MEFSREEYWSRLPFSSPGGLPDQGIDLGSPALQADSLLSEPQGKPPGSYRQGNKNYHCFSLETRWARDNEKTTFKHLKEKKGQLTILHMQNIPCKSTGKIKTFSDRQKWSHFTSKRVTPQGMIKELLRLKGKDTWWKFRAEARKQEHKKIGG